MRGRLLSISLLLGLAACADRGPAGEDVAAFAAAYGQDPIALRVALRGGPVRAYLYPRLDSVIWTSTQSVGAQAQVLAFDPENGLEAYVDRAGMPGWIDLRVGTIKPSRVGKLALLTSADAWSIFGVVRDTVIHRSTPSAEWELATPHRVTRLFPARDGSLVALYADDDRGTLLKLRPPERTVVDSTTVPLPTHVLMSPLGDRLYLAFGRDVAALNATTLDEVGRVTFDAPVTSLITSPSGDRVFVVTEGSRDIDLIDRYSGERTESIRLPGFPRELRMDPFGRLLLARPDSGDSVWVINVGSNKLVATLPTVWRADLPNVAPEGSVATIPNRDVHFTLPGQAKPRIIVRDGAAEIWHFVFWNGFRPRAAGLDQPVVFPVDTMSFASPVRDTAILVPARPDTQAARPPAVSVDSSPRPAAPSQWSVQLAAVLSEERAREIARSVRVTGAQPRVVTSSVDGSRVYRVVLGPYATKLEADRVGKLSGRAYWVFEGVP